MNKKLFLFTLLLLINAFIFIDNVKALDKDKYPDYLTKRRLSFQGTGPALREEHWITVQDHQFSNQITYKMENYRAILVQLRTEVRPTSVIMLASAPGTPRLLMPVWNCDDLRGNIVFWTDSYWISDQRCNSTGCPKIRFQATRGGLNVKILNRR